MGEARRRKLAGSYPAATKGEDLLEAARRRFAQQGAGSVEQFQCPDGLLALTLDVEGVPPSSVLFNPEEAFEEAERIARQLLTKPDYYKAAVQRLALTFIETKRKGNVP